jgi:hypothetical protein
MIREGLRQMFPQKLNLFWTFLISLAFLFSAGCATTNTGNRPTPTPTATPVLTSTSDDLVPTSTPLTLDDKPKTAESTLPIGSITNIRVGKHEGFDRLVVDLNAPGAGYDISYVDNVYTDGKGDLVPLKGGAKLRIVVRAPNHDADYHLTYQVKSGESLPNVDLTGFNTFQDAKWAGSFEGQSTIGLGVSARLPFTVFKLTNPGRIVVDVYLKA